MPDAVALLRGALEIYSPSGREQEIGRYLCEQMRAFGLRAELDGAGNAVGARGSGPRQIVMLGHMDTVPGFIPVLEEEGRLYGRGAVDAKAALATFIAATSRLPERADTTYLIVCAVEEECPTSRGARYALDRYRPSCAIIGEPSGAGSITLGYKGRLALGYRVEQPCVHSAVEMGRAAERAVDFWLAVKEMTAEYAAPSRFERLDAALMSFLTGGDGLTEHAALEISLRLPPGFEVARLRKRLETLHPDASLEVRESLPAFKAEKNTPLVRAFLQAMRARGLRPTFKVKTGTADMNLVGPAWRCPIVAYGPGDSSLDHTPHEHLDLAEYQLAIDILADVLSRL